MKNYGAVILVSFVILAYSCKVTVPTTSNTSAKLTGVVNNYWNDYLQLNPLAATQNGVNDYNHQLEIPISSTYIQKAKAFNLRYIDSLKKINKKELKAQELLIADLLEYVLKRDVQGLERGMYYSTSIERPVDQFVFSFPTRFATMASGAGAIPFRTVKDYEDFLERIKQFSSWIDTAISAMNRGLAKGNVNPKASMLKVPPQLVPLYNSDAQSHIFYKPINAIPDNFSGADKQRLQTAYTKAINETVKPAYRKLHDYLVNEYIPKARTSTGLINNPGGREEYLYWIHYWTTTDMTPDAVFELGIKEVARIRREMDSIKTLTGFTGDLSAFFQYVKTDPKFFPFKTEEEVLNRFRSFEGRMQPSLSKMFRLVPKATFEVRATEKFRQAGANAQYMRPSRDGSKPGIFYEVIPDPATYNYFDMETLYIHEAIPGHHFQIALQQEAPIPEFMKNASFSAFSEGWALYAEKLGKELGMFTDPYQYLGHLNADMERAARLVVDAGMHHKGWTREEAIKYVLENQPVIPAIAEQRIERYMVTPGQALSYKIGEQKILELKKEAQQKLGPAFDIRDFHDEMLKDGAMPLRILEDKMRRWINKKQRQ